MVMVIASDECCFVPQTNVATFRNAIRHSGLDVDQGYMPFGRLAQETIDKAREILHKIK